MASHICEDGQRLVSIYSFEAIGQTKERYTKYQQYSVSS